MPPELRSSKSRHLYRPVTLKLRGLTYIRNDNTLARKVYNVALHFLRKRRSWARVRNNMNFEIDFSSLPEYVRLTVEGTLQIEEFKKMWSEVLSPGDWKAGTPVLLDCRRRVLTSAETRDLASHLADFYLSHDSQFLACRVASLIGGPENFSFSRRLEYALNIRGSSIVLKTFYGESTAIGWLTGSPN